MKGIAEELGKYNDWNNKTPWTKRAINLQKGTYLALPDGTRNVLQLTLLKAAVAFMEQQIKLRTNILTEGVVGKWAKLSKQVRSAIDALALMPPVTLPYSAAAVTEISVISLELLYYTASTKKDTTHTQL